MKKSILWLFAAAWALGVCAGPVLLDDAKIAATAWAAKNAAFGAGGGVADAVSVTDPTNRNVVLWHQVSMENGGMLVVAPVTEIEPVIVALDNSPRELPSTLRGILTADLRRRLQFLGLYGATSSGGASLMSVASAAAETSGVAKRWGELNNAKWGRLMAAAGGASLMAAPSVGLTDITVNVCTVKGFEKGGAFTHWHQGGDDKDAPLYNLHTPSNAVCGCVATASAALAQFYGTTNAVEFGKNCSYNGASEEYITRSGAIDWGILPANFGGTNATIGASSELTDEQRDLIGSVAYNAGVGVGMAWTDKESGAYQSDMVTALKDVFGFKNARAVFIEPEDNPDQEQLEKLMYNQVRAGVPVGFSIEGHSVVAVGYGLDADNVERVRVFMGWGGKGDGWYALPKIDAQATLAGSSHLSEIIDCIVTMISYDNDDIVPVVGRVVDSAHAPVTNAVLSIPALSREIQGDEKGYFGTRVPANLLANECTITCEGREATFDIGEAAAASEDAVALAEALPSAFEFPILKCTVAYSLERAKLLAEREGKAILRVSGTVTDTNTLAVLDYIYGLDDRNVDGFADKFVYLFSSSDSREGDGAMVSYGVYLPSALNVDDLWRVDNGALSYGYLSAVQIETNNTHNAGHVEVEGVTTNVTVSTFAPVGVAYAATTNSVDEVDVIYTNLLQSVADVVNVGARRFAESTSGITVEVTATSEAAEAAMGRHDGSYPNGVYGKCGRYGNCFVAGSNVTFTCNAEVTNETAGVVFGCAGWSVTNATTGAVSEGGGSEATFALASNDVVTLTWDLSKVVAVKVTVTWTDGDEVLKDVAAVTPGSGWYSVGTPEMFTAKNEVIAADGRTRYGFKNFTTVKLPDGTIRLSPLSVLVVPMDRPITIEAVYDRGSQPITLPEVTTTCAVTVSNCVRGVATGMETPAEGSVPNTLFFSQNGKVGIANEATADVPGTTNYLALAATTYVKDGVEMVLIEGRIGDESVDVDALPFETDLSTTNQMTVVWVWEAVSAAPVVPEKSVEDVLNEALSKDDVRVELDKSDKVEVVLPASAASMGSESVQKLLPEGFKVTEIGTDAEGNVTATVELDPAVLTPEPLEGAGSPLTIVSGHDGNLTVKADVANGVDGFWYTLYGSDNLVNWSPVTSAEYVSGTASKSAEGNGEVSLSIDVEPDKTKRFFKLVVTASDPTKTN